MKIGFIGAGNMTSAIVKGMIQQGHTPAQDIYISNRSQEKLDAFTKATGTQACSSNEELIAQVEVVVLAVKPNVLTAILPDLAPAFQQHRPLIVSIAAGTSLEKMANLLGIDQEHPIVRVMPNLNVQVGEGISSVSGNAFVTNGQTDYVLGVFNAIGQAIVLKEEDISAFIGIGGSSPAFTFLYIDSLARAGVKNGIPKALATKIAAQAVLGSAKMVLEGDVSPWDLIDQVSSPGGTTVAGIVALEDEAFISTVIKGVEASIQKDQELLKK